MATSLHNPYPRSPNPSTRSYSSSISSSASPSLPALNGQFHSHNSSINTSPGAKSNAPTAALPSAAASAAASASGPHHTGFLPPSLPSLHEYSQLQSTQSENYSQHHPYSSSYSYHPSPYQHYSNPQHRSHRFQPYPSATAGSAMGGRGKSLPPSDESLVSTPGQGYVALPPLHHAGGPGASGTVPPSSASISAIHGPPIHGSTVGSANVSSVASTPASSSSVPVAHTSMAAANAAAVAAAAAAAAAQQQQQQHVQKRAYRQRRKDPSCDACRERKVKCDATETTSCSECSNRQVKCQFTKETNRRMSSIKQMQDLERQLDRMRRENSGLRRMLQEKDPSGTVDPPKWGPGSDEAGAYAGSSDYHGHLGRQSRGMDQLEQDTDNILSAAEHNNLPLLHIPEIGSNPRRRHRRSARRSTGTPLLDFARARTNLRSFAKGVWKPPAPFDQVPSPTTATAATSTQLPQAIPDLPPRSTADTLLHAYYASVHTMLPMIHWQTFQQRVDRLYAAAAHVSNMQIAAETGRPSSPHPPPPPPPPTSFIALFFAVMAVGGLFCTYFVNPSPSSPPPSFSAGDLAEAARSLIDPWSMSGGDSRNAPVLDDARTLLLLAVFLDESNLKSAAWAWLGSAVRVAQDLGLYIEPESSVAHGGFGPLEAEMRRRVWWALYVLDRSLAVELGRPMLISDDDCDVALPAVVDDHYLADDTPGGIVAIPPGAEPLTQSMVAVLHVVRSYTALGRLLSAASSSLFSPSSLMSGRPASSSPSSTQSPASTMAGDAALAAATGTTIIPSTHLATFDQHFAACMRVFPPACDPSSQPPPAHQDGPVLSAHLLSPLVYLLHARLLLHRHNLAPTLPATAAAAAAQIPPHAQPASAAAAAALQARLSAVEQCTHTALETAAVVDRASLDELAGGAGATALVAAHLARCALFLLLAGHVDAAALLVRALAAVAVVRREVAVPWGRYLAFFASCLAFKRAEYVAYLARGGGGGGGAAAAATPQASQPPSQQQNSTQPSGQQLYDALVRDEELLAYASADLQAAPESAWVWDGEVVQPGAAAAAAAAAALTVSSARDGNVLSRLESRMGLSEEESRDWGGWERLESRVRSLASSSGGGASASAAPAIGTATATTAAAGPPPLTSYSVTTAGTASPVAHSHYTHQPAVGSPYRPSQQQPPPPPPPSYSHDPIKMEYQQQQPLPPHSSPYPPHQQPPHPEDPYYRQQQQQHYQQRHDAPGGTSSVAGGSGRNTPMGSLRVDSPVGSVPKSKSHERISIANII